MIRYSRYLLRARDDSPNTVRKNPGTSAFALEFCRRLYPVRCWIYGGGKPLNDFNMTRESSAHYLLQTHPHSKNRATYVTTSTRIRMKWFWNSGQCESNAFSIWRNSAKSTETIFIHRNPYGGELRQFFLHFFIILITRKQMKMDLFASNRTQNPKILTSHRGKSRKITFKTKFSSRKL